jgi:hypothetical protein
VSEGFIGTKRGRNETIREALRDLRDDEPIAFLCECRNERCYQTVWLTGPAYDRARSHPEWLALVRGHLAPKDAAKAVTSSAGAAPPHERAGRTSGEANDQRGSRWQMQRPSS